MMQRVWAQRTLSEVERSADRHRRVDRVAATLQNPQPDSRRERLTAGDHAVGGVNGRAAGAEVQRFAIYH